MGFAQSRTAVDEQRIVGLGRIGSHGLGSSMGKLVGVAHDEGGEGVLIIAALTALFDLLGAVPVEGRRLFLSRQDGIDLGGFFHAEDLHFRREAHHFGKAPGEDIHVLFGDHVLHEAAVHRELGFAVLEAHRLDRGDPEVIGHGADFLFAVLFDEGKNFRKGLHNSTLSFLWFFTDSTSPELLCGKGGRRVWITWWKMWKTHLPRIFRDFTQPETVQNSLINDTIVSRSFQDFNGFSAYYI